MNSTVTNMTSATTRDSGDSYPPTPAPDRDTCRIAGRAPSVSASLDCPPPPDGTY
jgi:hypothetical protein